MGLLDLPGSKGLRQEKAEGHRRKAAAHLSSLSLAASLRFGDNATLSERRGVLCDVGLSGKSEGLSLPRGLGSVCLSGQGSEVHWNLLRNFFVKTVLNYCHFLTKIYFGRLYTVN